MQPTHGVFGTPGLLSSTSVLFLGRLPTRVASVYPPVRRDVAKPQFGVLTCKPPATKWAHVSSLHTHIDWRIRQAPFHIYAADVIAVVRVGAG